MKKRVPLLFCILFFLCIGSANAQTIRYVSVGGNGTKTGNSWANASDNLQAIINASQNGDQVWVAAGTYFSASNGFQMKEGVAIYGGFPATENPIMADRDWIGNATILSGNNVYPIIYNTSPFVSTPLTRAAILDGFILTKGKASRGGAIYNNACSPTLRNLRIINNKASWGGGVYNTANSSPAISNTIIYGNTVDYFAGGVYNDGGSIELTNVVINANLAGTIRTSGIPNRSGGAIYNQGTTLTLTNVTIANNSSEEGAGKGTVHITGNSTVSIRNTIIYGNNVGLYTETGSTTTIAYSLVQGLNDTDNGNLSGDTDPMFASPYLGCLRLLAGSPAIDKGSNDYYDAAQTPNLSAIQTDVAGNSRFYNDGTVDMGAYEFQENEVTVCNELPLTGVLHPDANGIIYVKQTAIGTGDGSSWENASGNLQDAINVPTVRQVWVATGLYEPSAPIDMRNNVVIYGGFPSSGTPDMSHRNWTENETVLTGSGIRQIIRNDIDYTGASLDRTAVLDGFILTNGYGSQGGAIRNNQCSPTLRNLRIVNNKATWGGGIDNSNSSPIIINTTLYDNKSEYMGGAMYNSGGNVDLVNTVIWKNTAGGYYHMSGGAIYNTGTQLTLTNVTITLNENSALENIGVIQLEAASEADIRNSVIVDNNTDIYADGTSTVNRSYSLVQGYTDTDNGNISGDTNPMFAASGMGCFRLTTGSPLIDNGSNTYYNSGQTPDLSDISKDIVDNDRIYNAAVDIGAYEYQGENITQCSEIPLAGIYPNEQGIIHVKETATGNADGSSWDDATDNLQAAINTVGVKKVWVATGTYYTPSTGLKMKKNVAIMGGFPSDGSPSETDRNWKENETILSGANTHRVIYNYDWPEKNIDSTAVLDGFTIRDGSTNDGGAAIYNLYASPLYKNLLITNNAALGTGTIYVQDAVLNMDSVTISNNSAYTGGAIATVGISALILKGSVITNNSATLAGGGIYLFGLSDAQIRETIIKENHSQQYGGGIYSIGNLNIINSLIADNEANRGGAIYVGENTNTQAKTTVVNTTIVNNVATDNGAAFFVDHRTDISIINSIVTENLGSTAFYTPYSFPEIGTAIIKNNIISGTATGVLWQNIYGAENNNVNEDPLFTDAENGDYTLQSGSPAINIGSNTLYTEAGGDLENDKDFAGNKRLAGVKIDIGAYEAPNLPPSVSNVSIAGSLNAWKALTPTFTYIDPENDTMDTTKSLVQWYLSFNAEGTSSFPMSTGFTFRPQDYLVGFYVAVEVTPNDGSQAGNAVMSQWIGPIQPAESTVRYVRQGGNGDMSGTSWENASPDLQAMIDASSPGGIDEIWVAEGKYVPVRRADNTAAISADDQNNAFVINKDVKILGGFAATGNPQKADRKWNTYKTILSGDLDDNDALDGTITGNNAYHVLISVPGQDDYTPGTLDGFVIKGGTANGSENIAVGGNNIFGNRGGGVYLASMAGLSLYNTNITQNKAVDGAGIYSPQYSSLQLNNLIINGNEASNQGGGILFEQASTQLNNSLISGNIADTGAGIAAIGSFVVYTNNTISGNKAVNGGAIYNNSNSNYMMYNAILWGNSSEIEGGTPVEAINNIVQGGLSGENNLDINPLFLNALSYEAAPFTGGDYRLGAGSPAIDAGSNDKYIFSGLNPETSIDLAGKPRILDYNTGGIIDIGAYESDPTTLPVTLVDFTAKAENNLAKLQWKTANEQNNKGFTIYRSSDDVSFVKLGEVSSSGIQNPTPYTFTDYSPLNGINYYKLVQIDNDGKETELGVRTVNFSLVTSNIRLFPNPTSNEVTISFETGKYNALTVTDITGKRLQHLQINPSDNHITVVLGSYPKGIYLLYLTGKGSSEMAKVLKK